MPYYESETPRSDLPLKETTTLWNGDEISPSNNAVLKAMEWRLSPQSKGPKSEPFCVMDLGYVHNQYEHWEKSLPSVTPFYAVKCNPDVNIIGLLGSVGCGFDCASRSEIELVLGQGIPAGRIIFANPCKKPSDIDFARNIGVNRMTFDNEAELHKIKQLFPESQLVLRCFASDPSATYCLSSKFGAHPEASMSLLECAKSLGLNVIGVSFHVGSSSKDPKAFEIAIQNSRRIFDAGSRMGHNMRLLDIGGGFSENTFDDMAESIQRSLDFHFGDIDAEVVAEPGRYFAAGALTVACEIIARRDAKETPPSAEEATNMLYLNDGIYGTFLCNLFEPGPLPRVLCASGIFYPQTAVSDRATYIIWGPTCDGTDCIAKGVELPERLTFGDWLYFPDMGGKSFGSNFHPFSPTLTYLNYASLFNMPHNWFQRV
ncbi:Ornithine decarboxylase [Penicillium brasilianum]|uniref:ornithine decarboxylase n=1 Tax=Penicillium brasilianum TaxID=104259 RepID=A0A1S9S0C5_PENBI|nr:Ornithine decarboxylase [Penicillium brasilianum]